MDDKKVIVRDLYEHENKWENAKVSELLAAGYLAKVTTLSQCDKLTEGFFPGYDFVLKDGTKIEVKYSLHETYSLEISKRDGGPSGLSATTADYYLIISLGNTNQRGKWIKVGKVRLIPIKTLHEYRENYSNEQIPYEKGAKSEHSICIKLDFKKLFNKDGWLGDVPIETNADGKIIGYNMDPTKIGRVSRDHPFVKEQYKRNLF